jgi:hypothetical protein
LGDKDVALDATKEQALKDVSLVKLFEDHRELWKEDAKSAYAFIDEFLDVVRPLTGRSASCSSIRSDSWPPDLSVFTCGRGVPSESAPLFVCRPLGPPES